MRKLSVSLVPLAMLVACASTPPAPPAVAPPTPAVAVNVPQTSTNPSTPAMPTPFDPVAVGLTADGQRHLCDDHLRAAQAILDEIKSLKGAPAEKLTYANTIGRFDDAVDEIGDAQSFPGLMAVAHPSKDVRDAAKECEPKVDKITTGLFLDADLASVLKAYAAKGEKLEGERAKLLTETLRDFRRNGLDLTPDKQDQLRKLNEELTKLGQEFEQNIPASKETLKIDPKQLEGLPADYVAKHKPGADGKVEITTDYPDFFPFVKHAKDRKAAKDLYVIFTNRGGEKNVQILERLLKLRSDKAKLLGYATWADYQTEPRMAKNAKTVNAFLQRVRDAVKAPAKAEYAEFQKEHALLGGKATDKLPPSDRYFLEERLNEKKYKFDSVELSNYFEIGAVKKGLLDISAKIYGLTYKEVPANAWHEDVTAYEVYSDGKLIGKFYFNLAPRADKFKHAAMFPVRSGKRMADGSYQLPMAVLECNFPKSAGPNDPPALMEHADVTVFFHEFGHVLHHILTKSELASYSGSNTVRDFVEAPSQMFEEWSWDRGVLDLFAKHYKTGAKIPDALYAAMTKSRAFGRALGTQRQLFLASLDFEFHSREPGFDTTKVLEEIQHDNDPFEYVKGTHFQSSFGHLVGYDAGYYSYQWALSLSRDVLTRFKKEGLLNTTTAKSWRDEVLALGGGRDEKESVAKFLGREPNEEAYIAFLKGKD